MIQCTSLYSTKMKLNSPSCFILFLCILCQTNLLFVSSLPLQVTSTLPTSLTKVNSSIQHNFNTTEWSRNDKVERRDEFPDDQNNLSPGKLVANGIGRMIRAYNSVVETIFLPFNLATEVFFAGLGKLYPIG
ncbi:uncharacterized protein LOC107363976 [Tetranychus urticae]|uniref:uncharacterized protein LOC107363976 n=1 Tax=Tetranychus urticae TaxID=32264 RepID=UPI00077BA549|nr:uncharacterized protein LOC107363976 [Tetranychus urticae]